MEPISAEELRDRAKRKNEIDTHMGLIRAAYTIEQLQADVKRLESEREMLREAGNAVLGAHEAHERGESPLVPWGELKQALAPQSGIGKEE